MSRRCLHQASVLLMATPSTQKLSASWATVSGVSEMLEQLSAGSSHTMIASLRIR